MKIFGVEFGETDERARLIHAGFASQAETIATLTAKLAESENTALKQQLNISLLQRVANEDQAEIDALKQQLAEAQRDAARYRYLRDVADAYDWEKLSYQCGEYQDAMIDEAMAKIATDGD